MSKVTIFLSALLSINTVWAASGTSAVYQTRVNPNAESYEGKTFNRQFDLSQTIVLAGSVTATAKAYDSQSCEAYDPDNDTGKELTCVDVCVTTASFDVGTIAFKATDLESKKTLATKPHPITVTASVTVEGKCEGRVSTIAQTVLPVELGSASYEQLVFGKKTYPAVALAVIGKLSATIRDLGNNQYELMGTSLPKTLMAQYSYAQELSWSVNGLVNLEQANK